MYKKQSDNKINEFIDLGNNTYEFCFNFEQIETTDFNNVTKLSYIADAILVTDLNSILTCLLRDKYSEILELKIISESISNRYNNKYIEYKKYLKMIDIAVRKFYLSKYLKETKVYYKKKYECEHLNNKYIFRFNETEVDNNWQYDEYIFDTIKNIDDINIINDILFTDNLILSDTQCKFVINTNTLTIEDIREIRLSELNPILNDYTIAVYKCNLFNITISIDVINEIITSVINKIKSFTNISDLLKYNFENEIIDVINFIKIKI